MGNGSSQLKLQKKAQNYDSLENELQSYRSYVASGYQHKARSSVEKLLENCENNLEKKLQEHKREKENRNDYENRQLKEYKKSLRRSDRENQLELKFKKCNRGNQRLDKETQTEDDSFESDNSGFEGFMMTKRH